MPTITICWRDIKIVALGGHARDDVLTSRVAHIDVLVDLVKSIRF